MADRMWRWRRAAAVVLAAVAVAAVTYRVLAPAEVLTPARTGYPAGVATARPGVIGTLTAAPLIVDGRVRIYATTRQVRADSSLDAGTVRTPYWSYRRWPAQLIGVVAAGTTVVSRWSDGELVALDARAGQITWRTTGPDSGQEYEGRRTGAATLYLPPGLYSGMTGGGRAVLVVSGDSGLRGFDMGTGRELWRSAIDSSCRSEGFTTTSGYFATIDRCDSPGTVWFYDLATGAVTARWRPGGTGTVAEVAPVGCASGRSACPAMRTSDGDGSWRGWLLDGAGTGPAAAPTLDPPGAWLVGGVVVRISGTAGARLTARPARTGPELWHREVAGLTRVLTVQSGRIHLLTGARELVTLDSVTGAELSRFPLSHGRDPMDWATGFVYASNGFIAVERLAEPVDPSAADAQYYADIQPVILAGT